MKLSGKVALITGSGSGIGKAAALLFAKEGASIAVSDINLSSAEQATEAIKQLGGRAIAIRADVSDAGDVDMMVDKVIKELGGIHILVNNAGIPGENLPTIESSVEHWDKVVRVNLRGTYLCSRRSGQWMVSNKAGKVLNIASIVGLAGFVARASYGPAKAGIVNLTQTLAVEWAKYNINVNCIAPGFVMTPLDGDLIRSGRLNLELIEKRIPLGHRAQPDDIAKAALFLVSDDARYITGVTLPVDGGWLAYGDVCAK
ncbi:MAG: hypothetical protein CL875_05705 [Dehalococcoidales bacterium]|nr:hypothetical protein [Dehalococcoidales bacterium]